jgi:hypothetical protein
MNDLLGEVRFPTPYYLKILNGPQSFHLPLSTSMAVPKQCHWTRRGLQQHFCYTCRNAKVPVYLERLMCLKEIWGSTALGRRVCRANALNGKRLSIFLMMVRHDSRQVMRAQNLFPTQAHPCCFVARRVSVTFADHEFRRREFAIWLSIETIEMTDMAILLVRVISILQPFLQLTYLPTFKGGKLAIASFRNREKHIPL